VEQEHGAPAADSHAVDPHAADAHAAADHASAGFPPFDQFDTFPSQIFWLVVTFGALYLVTAFWLVPAVRKTIGDREDAIARDVGEAAAASQKADQAARALEARIAEARGRARDTAGKAKSEADARIAAETAKVEADLAQRLAKAEANIAGLRSKAMANVSTVAEDAVAAIAEKLGGVKPSAAAVKKAVADAMGKA
jgi:F-type H+-transporting ATPase subunit b